MELPAPEVVQCPHCQAENPASGATCHACGRPLAIYIGPPARVRSFGLGSVMLLIAVIAVCLGVARFAPGLGIVMLLIATPALARTVIAATRRAADERPLTGQEKVEVFLASTGLMFLVLLASGAAFVATCFPVGLAAFSVNSTPGVVLGFVIGAGAALAAAFFLLRRFWPRSRSRPEGDNSPVESKPWHRSGDARANG